MRRRSHLISVSLTSFAGATPCKPATKDNLESQRFLSFSSEAQARLTRCLRNDGDNIRPFITPSEAIEAIKRGLNRVQPKNPP